VPIRLKIGRLGEVTDRAQDRRGFVVPDLAGKLTKKSRAGRADVPGRKKRDRVDLFDDAIKLVVSPIPREGAPVNRQLRTGSNIVNPVARLRLRRAAIPGGEPLDRPTALRKTFTDS